MLTPTLEMETGHSQLGGNKGVNLHLGPESVLGQLGQDRRRGLPQGDVSEAEVSDLVLSVAVRVDDVDVGPGVGHVPGGAAEVDEEPLPRLVLRVGVLAAVARAGRLITLLGLLRPAR